MQQRAAAAARSTQASYFIIWASFGPRQGPCPAATVMNESPPALFDSLPLPASLHHRQITATAHITSPSSSRSQKARRAAGQPIRTPACTSLTTPRIAARSKPARPQQQPATSRSRRRAGHHPSWRRSRPRRRRRRPPPASACHWAWQLVTQACGGCWVALLLAPDRLCRATS
jgi:hypothetical protein